MIRNLMIGIKEEILNKIYEDDRILNYLRYNPFWYKILYYEPDKIDDFMNEAKKTLKITVSDNINNFKNQVDFISSLIEYINK